MLNAIRAKYGTVMSYGSGSGCVVVGHSLDIVANGTIFVTGIPRERRATQNHAVRDVYLNERVSSTEAAMVHK